MLKTMGRSIKITIAKIFSTVRSIETKSERNWGFSTISFKYRKFKPLIFGQVKASTGVIDRKLNEVLSDMLTSKLFVTKFMSV